jgi:glycine cleavage system regulatory protein
MLDIEYTDDADLAPNTDDTDDADRVETTVVELAGVDRCGLLADVTDLLTGAGCDVRSAAVWTAGGRVAFVLSVTEKGRAVEDGAKAARLAQALADMMGGHKGGGGGGADRPHRSPPSPPADCVVRLERVRGDVRHDRRLHTLLLREEARSWGHGGANGEDASPSPPAGPATPGSASASPDRQRAGGASSALHASSAALARPAIAVRPCSRTGYWTVTIACGDRPKLLFDTLCTLSDLEYDVFHATVGASPLPAPSLTSMASLGGSASSLDGGWGTADGGPSAAAAPAACRPASAGRRPSAGGIAHQEYYIKPRWAAAGGGGGDGSAPPGSGGGGPPCFSAPLPVVPAPLAAPAVGPPPAYWDPARGAQLAAALEASILRRVPRGLKLHVRSHDRFGCLANLAAVLRGAGLTITRAKVRTFAADRSSGHTFYVMASGGATSDGLVPPDRSAVQAACAAAGGHLADPSPSPDGGGGVGGGAHHHHPHTTHTQARAFSYSFLSRRAAGGGRGGAVATPGIGAQGLPAKGGAAGCDGGQGWHGAASGGAPTPVPAHHARGVPTPPRPRVGSLPGASPDSDGSF